MDPETGKQRIKATVPLTEESIKTFRLMLKDPTQCVGTKQERTEMLAIVDWLSEGYPGYVVNVDDFASKGETDEGAPREW